MPNISVWDTHYDGGNERFMQQTQEKPQQKTLNTLNAPKNELKNSAYRPSPVPTVLATSAKVCYGLSAASLILSVGIWNRVSTPKLGKQAKKVAKRQQPTERQYRESQQLGAFVGLLSPTLAVVGKVLDDASERVAISEFARWEKQQSDKARSLNFARFFVR
jgi:hypothetical protein